jgi:hypothetical protein
MRMLLDTMTHEQVIAYEIDWQVFKDWDKSLNLIYKRMLAVLKWQMFQSSTELGIYEYLFQEQQPSGCPNVEGKSTEIRCSG